MNNREMVRRSLAAVWHPCTQMKAHESVPMLAVAGGKGAWLYDFEGNRYVDGVSSWWVNLFGHAHPQINAALKEQIDALEHVMLAGATHAPAVELAGTTREARARQPRSRVLRFGRRFGHRDRAQDGLPLLEESRDVPKNGASCTWRADITGRPSARWV
jgi:glutamate-1-semialdehyde aminotransferase